MSKSAEEKKSSFRMSDEGVITFGKDEQGNAYGPENTPKRSDSTKGLWAKYRDGMTVKEAIDAGLSRSNVRRDRRAGFIVVTNPEKPAEEAAAE